MCTSGLFSCFASSAKPHRKARGSTSTSASTDADSPSFASPAHGIHLNNRTTRHPAVDKPLPRVPPLVSAPPQTHQPSPQPPQQSYSGTVFREPQAADGMAPARGGVHKTKAAKSSSGRGKHSKFAAAGYFNAGAPPPPAGSSASSNDSKLDKMFDDLRNAQEDGKDALGVESTMAYLTSLGLNPESGEIFVALELVKAPNFGEITRKGFVDGWRETGVTASKSAHQQHIHQRVGQLTADPAYFRKVYRYTFVAGKEPEQRALALDNAIEFWRVLFTAPGRPWRTASHDWLTLWTTFLEEKWTRTVNRDMWNQLLEFATRTLEDDTLAFWSEDGAWPSVIDEFVAWCRTRGIGAGAGAGGAMETES